MGSWLGMRSEGRCGRKESKEGGVGDLGDGTLMENVQQLR